MGHPLKKVAISGYKCIKSLNDLHLGPLNIIVGANGAGKSNFVGFFKMLRAMSQEGLGSFVVENGGADGFFFGGPKMTREITSHLTFSQSEYRFALAPTVSSGIMVKEESTRIEGPYLSGTQQFCDHAPFQGLCQGFLFMTPFVQDRRQIPPILYQEQFSTLTFGCKGLSEKEMSGA